MGSKNHGTDKISPTSKANDHRQARDTETSGETPTNLHRTRSITVRGNTRSSRPLSFISTTQQPSQPRALAAMSASDRPQKCDSAQAFAHVMVVKFSHEEIELPKATVLGMAEEVSESLVAALNDESAREITHESGSII
jgi:hypothetical protein